jgi:hypothetical protein
MAAYLHLTEAPVQEEVNGRDHEDGTTEDNSPWGITKQ